MNRRIVYQTQILQSADFLQAQKNASQGLSQLASDIMTSAGTAALLVGLACTPTSPAGMTVNVGPGSVYQQSAMDPTAFGSLPSDSATYLQQGVLSTLTNLSGFTAPGTAGQSINYLIQVQFAWTDANAKVLPYYNSANPTVTLNGPGGGGGTQNTDRNGVVSLQVVAGTAATTGTQATPGVTAGWIPAYVVTVANGQTTITAPNIAVHASAPFYAGTTAQHHKGTPGQAPKIDLTTEVQNLLPYVNLPIIRRSELSDLQCSAGTGLNLNYNSGTTLIGNTPTAIAAGTIALTDNTTNYVFVNASGVVTANTTGFPTTGGITPMASPVTSGGAITSINDKRGIVESTPVDLSAVAKTANGYVKLPNGLIIQWFTSAAQAYTAPSGMNFAITLPIAFPTANLWTQVATLLASTTINVFSETYATSLTTVTAAIASATSQNVSVTGIAIGY